MARTVASNRVSGRRRRRAGASWRARRGSLDSISFAYWLGEFPLSWRLGGVGVSPLPGRDMADPMRQIPRRRATRSPEPDVTEVSASASSSPGMEDEEAGGEASDRCCGLAMDKCFWEFEIEEEETFRVTPAELGASRASEADSSSASSAADAPGKNPIQRVPRGGAPTPPPKPKAASKMNYVGTAKYSVWTFLPRGIFEQFRRVANVFFLWICE